LSIDGVSGARPVETKAIDVLGQSETRSFTCPFVADGWGRLV